MENKICLVTGGNSGIGYATAEGLAKRGATVVIVSRNAERGEAARQAIVRSTGNDAVDLMTADLSSLEDIRRLAITFEERNGKLDVLVNNAGGVFYERGTSKDGNEMTFAVNYLAPFLLTHLLTDKLKASGEARIVNVASTMQAKRLDLDQLADPARYSAMGAYQSAKTAVIMMTYYMAKQLKDSGITVNALHPGVIYTPQSSKAAPAFTRPLLKLFMRSPEQGAGTTLYLATSEAVTGSSGGYYKNEKPASTVPVSYDEKLQKRLYEKSLSWTGLDAIRH